MRQFVHDAGAEQELKELGLGDIGSQLDIIEAAGAKSLGPSDVEPLGRDIIHTVTNPLPRLTGAIHVYGGDFFATPRSEWDPDTLVEAPFDVQTTMRMFEEANALYEARVRAS